MEKGKLPADRRCFTLYIATNTVNGKRYIGATCKSMAQRRREHEWAAETGRPRCRKFGSALRKHGYDAFVWQVIATYSSHQELMDAERAIISAIKPEYNITAGGRGIIGVPRTPEWRAKISAAQKGKIVPPHIIEKMRQARLLSKSGRRAVVCLNDGAWFESVKDAVATYGVSHGRIANSASGREVSANGLFFAYAEAALSNDECATLMASRKDRLARRGDKSRMALARGVVCVNDGTAFETVAAAAKAHGLHPMSVVHCCRDGAVTKNGLRFRYAGQQAKDKHNKTKAELADIRRRQNLGLRKSWKRTEKPVVCLDDGVVYESITHAANAYGKHVSLISAAIHRKGRSGGHAFRFVSEQE